MPAPEHGSGTCRTCGRTFTLTKRGGVRHHGVPKVFPPERCPGAGEEPREHLRVGRDYQIADVFRALGEPVPPFWAAQEAAHPLPATAPQGADDTRETTN
jgi:hypothetical protein